MDIPAKLVKELRDRTGAGFMDAKRALIEANGDLDAAAEVLRKTGLAKADKRLDREAKEGKIGFWLAEDRSRGIMVELNCETDFVARTDEFKAFLQAIINAVRKNSPKDMDALKALPLEEFNNDTVENQIKEHIARIGENIKLKRFADYTLSQDKGIVDIYLHPGDMLGVMVELEAEDTPENAEVAHNIAMQIAATEALAVSRQDLPEDVVAKEKEIYRDQLKQAGKPEHVLDRAVEGKMKSFFAERVLLEQSYIKNPDITVADYLKSVGDPRVVRFVRFKVGED